MKNLLILVSLAALTGCATHPGPANYGTRAQYAQGDPSEWRVVSVTPVAPGTSARVAAAHPNGERVEYSSAPVVAAPPVYYQPAPVYAEPPQYYYPPVTLSLGFVLGRHWGSGYRHRGFRRHR